MVTDVENLRYIITYLKHVLTNFQRIGLERADDSRGRSGNNVISEEVRGRTLEVFASVGRFTPASFYTNRVPLLGLPKELIEAVRTGKLHYTKARKLARVTDDRVRVNLLERTLSESLSLTDLEALIREHRRQPEPKLRLSTTVNQVKRSLTPAKLERLSVERKREVEQLLERLHTLLDE